MRPFPSYKHELEYGLLHFLPTARWFKSKSRQIIAAVLLDQIPLGPEESASPGSILIVEARFSTGQAESYAIPAQFATDEKMQAIVQNAPARILLRIHPNGEDSTEGILYDPMADAAFSRTLVECLAKERRLPGLVGTLVPHLENPSLRQVFLGTPRPIGLEQSNSSVLFPGQYFLKLFRKLEEGVHPEAEMGLFLAASQRFPHAPQVTGTWNYQLQDKTFALGILQDFVPSESDAWSLLGNWIDGIVGENRLENRLETSPHYAKAAQRLGQRTAEMHLALATPTGDEAFNPQPFSPSDLHALSQSLRTQAQRVHQKTSALPEAIELGDLSAYEKVFETILASHDTGMRIRIHGDFHLGQILYNNEDFIFVDFEGEPARSLSERRQKRSALCDVAGLLRSFSYAAEHFIKQRPGLRPDGPECGLARSVARWLGGEFLESYFARMDTSPILPRQPSSRIALLKFFLLEKALYEIEYEMENRPDWVSIPLRGIQELLESTL